MKEPLKTLLARSGLAFALLSYFLSGCGESPQVSPMIDSLTLESDSFELSSTHESQMAVFEALFIDEGSYRIPGDPAPARLRSFFEEIRESYCRKAEGIDYTLIGKQYHTFTHAMDVMIVTHALLRSGGGVYLSDGEAASLVLAGLGHDAMHTGVTNTFLINSKHPFLEETGTDSLQEKRSVKHMLNLMDKHEILVVREDMSPELQAEIIGARNLIEQSILWTDITRHKDQLKIMSSVVPEALGALSSARGQDGKEKPIGAVEGDLGLRGKVSSTLADDTRVLLGAFFLHAADINNPGRDWATCERWAGLVMNEFFSQGDLEKKLKLPVSMLCDRDKVKVPFAQIGFGKFVIRDLYQLLKQISPTAGSYLLNNFEENQKKWQAIEENVLSSGKPYEIKFHPPTREGGWDGNSSSAN